MGISFSLNQVPEFAELTALYDAYSIDKVEITFVWAKPYTGPAAGDARTPTMLITRDYDDANAPVTFDEVGAYSDSRLVPLSIARPTYTIPVEPRTAKALFRSGVSSAYGWGEKSAVIDAANADVPHFGLKLWTTDYNSTETPNSFIKIFIKFHITGYATR
jgi:hypothetical protein